MSAAEILAPAPAAAAKPKPVVALVVAPNLIHLRHDQLQASPLNPRQHKPTPEEIAELADSIATKGIIHNLVARPLKGAKDKYELAAGETRWRAVGKLIADKRADAGYLISVSVRELSDEEVIEIGLVENGRRNALHPLDEARAFLKLYTARMKDGRKAVGDVVNGLADKIGKSVRYVQLRLAVARNLAPKATEYLEQAVVNVHVATTLAKRTLEEQRRFLSQHGKERLAQVTARDVDNYFRNQWRPMSEAVFAHAAYKGPTSELDGVLYATDAKAFDALQKATANKIREDSAYLAKKGMIAFFAEGEHFSDYDYEVRKVEGVPDPKGGVFLVWSRWNNKVEVHRGLRKTKDKLAREKREAEWRARDANRRSTPTRKTDPRMKAAAAQLVANTKALMAIELHNTLCGYKDSINWINIGGYLGDKKRGPVVDALKKLGKFEGQKGAAQLKWLLSKSRAELEPAWCALQMSRLRINPIDKPSQADLIVFDHCGVTKLEATPKKKGKAK